MVERMKIVCVDDEKFVLDSLVMQIRKMFGSTYSVEIAGSGEEGLELISELKSEGHPIPVVISDYIMPNMKGDVFLIKAGIIDPNIHKILLTGQATIDGVANAINKANLYRYISKPWDETDLRLTINEAVKSWNQNKEIKDLVKKYETLYLEAHKSYLRAQENFISSIRALSNAIDARDRYTIGHSRRVTQYAMQIGEQLGLPKEHLDYLEYMAILHDIGKIGIPDAILHKKCALTSEEFDAMKQHVTIGVQILEDVKTLEPLLSGILYHHERYDGRGYVHNKSKHNIPLEARIISVADAYDAMTSDRPYRCALDTQDAIMELVNNKGAQFDPEIVDIFVDIICSKGE